MCIGSSSLALTEKYNQYLEHFIICYSLFKLLLPKDTLIIANEVAVLLLCIGHRFSFEHKYLSGERFLNCVVLVGLAL